MIISESEYYVLQTMNGMGDRVLASMMELLIFPTSWRPSKHLAAFERILQRSDGEAECIEAIRRYIKASGAKFVVSESYYQQVTDEIRAILLLNGVLSQPLDDVGQPHVILLNGREMQ